MSSTTGKQLTTTAISLDRVVNGRIAERYVELDFLGMLLRAGAKVAAPKGRRHPGISA